MRSLLALAALALAVVAAVLLLQTEDSRGAGPGPDRTLLRDTSGGDGPRALDRVDGGPAREGRVVARTAQGADPDRVAGAATERELGDGRCVLVGRVVDEDGLPLEDAAVQVISHERWSLDDPGDDVSLFGNDGGSTSRGFETRSAQDGAFRLEVPVPHATRVWLTVGLDRLHRVHRAGFGRGSFQSGPKLAAGTRDLGDITLAPAGVVFGRVTGPDGSPVQGVSVSVQSASGQTGPDGRYVLEQVPFGRHQVLLLAAGYVALRSEAIVVDAPAEVGPLDYALEAAPTISGRVVNTEGEPIARARLQVSATRGVGGVVTVVTREDGGFETALTSKEPHWIRATADGHVESVDTSTTYEPGADDVVITLEPMPTVELMVRAAESGERLEWFGANVVRDAAQQFGGRPIGRSCPHPEQHRSSAELEAREGVDSVVVWALGRVLVEAPVALDEPGGGRMTVALERAAAVTGRLVRDGEPVPNAPVEVVGLQGGQWEQDATRRDGVSGPDGRFRIEGVGGGPHRLRVTLADAAPTIVEGLAPAPPATLDLGDVEVGAGGAIAGTVVVPAGVDPSGLVVRRRLHRKGGTAVVDARGRFRFDRVEVGAHELLVEQRRGELARSMPFPVEVVDGRTTDAVLDLRDREMVEVALTLDMGALDPEGVFVRLVSVDRPAEPDPMAAWEHEQRVGFADAAGVARAPVRAMGPSKVLIASKELGLVEHPTAHIDLRPGEPIERLLRFEWASADLRLPAAPALPEQGELVLEVGSDRGPIRVMRFGTRKGALVESRLITLDGATISVAGLRPGDASVRVYARRIDAAAARARPGDDGVEPLWSFEGEATLAAGRANEVVLE